MSEDTTIVLELTPKEAMILSEMLGTYSWTKGPHGEAVRDMYIALDEVSSSFDKCPRAITVTEFGILGYNAIWLMDA